MGKKKRENPLAVLPVPGGEDDHRSSRQEEGKRKGSSRCWVGRRRSVRCGGARNVRTNNNRGVRTAHRHGSERQAGREGPMRKRKPGRDDRGPHAGPEKGKLPPSEPRSNERANGRTHTTTTGRPPSPCPGPPLRLLLLLLLLRLPPTNSHHHHSDAAAAANVAPDRSLATTTSTSNLA